MSGDDLGRLTYLVLLGAVLIFWVFVNNRNTLNKTLQHAALWALIFVGAIAAVGLWGDIRQASTFRQSVSDSGTITVPRSPDGHYYLTLEINDAPIRFVVDTGATDMVLSKADARAAGVTLESADFRGQAQTANGVVRVAPVNLDKVRLGSVIDRNLRASVNDGNMDTSLLGMRYLQRFSRLEIAAGELVLER